MTTSPGRLTMFGDDDAMCVDGVCHVPSPAPTTVAETTQDEPVTSPEARAGVTEVAH